MKAQELRIGNLILKHDGSVITVTGKFLAEYEGHENEQILTNPPRPFFSGIPITEEWLLKAGFHRQTSNHYYIFYKDKVLFTIYNGSLVIEGGYMPIKLEFVHELQNLIHSLTGEELEFKI